MMQLTQVLLITIAAFGAIATAAPGAIGYPAAPAAELVNRAAIKVRVALNVTDQR